MADDGEDESLIRIVISTDNHLGYKERDPIRSMDSFAAFEEVLVYAKSNEADMLLLGGDIFHENKPTRKTMHQTFDLLREYVLGDEPVGFQIISDQREAFADRRGLVNYEDPNFAIGLPVFAIHGNHDDPTREGGTEALAALDLLSITNFVNYFGKQEKVDDVCIKPILIQKGTTKLALYGLGNIRDERLNRMWTKQKVKFLRPPESEGRDSFFNILVLHQNRAEGRGRKNAIFESMIPDWFDVVVWGHEHECQTAFQESLHGRFRVIQPGSTVATSLVDGEAEPKHLAVLELKDQQFRLRTHRLQSVRPFVTDEVRLDDEEFGLDPDDVKVEEAIDRVLDEHVQNLITRARRERADALAAQTDQIEPNRLCIMQEPNQVLLRIKVDRRGFQTLNNQRFGARFVGDVANPGDILLFHQRRRAVEDGDRAKPANAPRSRPGGSNPLAVPVAPDLDDLKVEDLIADQLNNSDSKLRLLKESELKDALDEYVNKQQPNAIDELVQHTLEDTQKKLNSSEFRAANTAALIHDAVEHENQETQDAERLTQSQVEGSQAPSQANAEKRSGKRPARASDEDDEFDDDDDLDDDDGGSVVSEPPKKVKKASTAASKRPQRSRTSTKKSIAVDDDDDDDVEDANEEDDEFSDYANNEDDDSDVEVVEVSAPAKRSRRAPTKTAAKSRGRATASQSSSSSQRSGRSLPGFLGGSKKSSKKSAHASDDWA